MNLLNKRNVLRLASLGVASLVVLAFGNAAHAQLQPGYTVLSAGHVDLGVLSEDGTELELHIHDEESDTEFGTDQALLHLPDNNQARLSRPTGSQWDFLGTSAGSNIWIAPQSQNQNLIYLGIANEDLSGNPGSAGKFTGQTTFSLVSVTGQLGAAAPGNFSVFQTDSFGNPVPFFTTSNGINSSDVINFNNFTHQHFNYAFSGLGVYEVTIRAESALVGGGSLVDQRTYTFGIGTTSAAVVPEAGTLPLVLGAGASVVGTLAIRRRTKKA